LKGGIFMNKDVMYTADMGGGSSLKIEVNPEVIRNSAANIGALGEEVSTKIENMISNIEAIVGVVSTTAKSTKAGSVEVLEQHKTQALDAIVKFKDYINSVATTYTAADTGTTATNTKSDTQVDTLN